MKTMTLSCPATELVADALAFVKHRYEQGTIAHPAYRTEGSMLLRFHILPVFQHATELSHRLSACCEVAQLAALFHDISRLDGDDETHHVSSGLAAASFLKDANATEDMVGKVQVAILEHRGSVARKRTSIESKIVCSADGFATIYAFPWAFYSAYSKHKLSLMAGAEKVVDKLWKAEKKLLPESRTMLAPAVAHLATELAQMIKEAGP